MMNQWIICLILQLLFKLCIGTHVEVVTGSTLNLPCFPFLTELSGAPISWKFNGVDIISSDSVTTNATHLSISPVKTENQGEYVCSAMDPDQNFEMRRTYSVIVKGFISYIMLVAEGTNARLPCNYGSDHQVKGNALWFKEMANNKIKMLTHADHTMSEDGKAGLLYPMDHDQTMSLRDVTMEDQGLYHCDSPDGARLSTVELIVKSAPTLPPHSCEGFTTPWEECEGDHENTRVTGSVLKESLTEFAFKLYSAFKESKPLNNFLYSPISISGALAHLLLGSRNKTRAALEGALSLPPMFHCVHSEMKRLREKLSGSLQMASQIYYNRELNLSRSFLKQSDEFYDSEPVKLKEDSEENVQMINSWVADKTKDKIRELVKDVPQSTQLMLLNAVSFSGMWTIRFDEKTSKGYFTKLDGDMVKVPVLRNDDFQGSMAFVPQLKTQVMRFELTGNNSLYILLPQTHKASDLQQVESRLTDAAVRQMIDQVQGEVPQSIQVILPQIKLKSEQDMNVIMKKLGLFSLFEGGNLCGLYAEQPLVLDEAKHKAFLALTEEGVEAAAATVMGFSRSHPSFSALRPFILLLWSDTAQVPLFIGRVTEP
ncbi:plasma protease C1 inhibitor [Periophthalmus magnuspinnatus]|uniref:plasma protease C1 inhibitor n=1 Tax=Periophthalmus magnuspinnatus TaxID=409849 RepID=UPI002436BEDB|nr:plasma protease C1 inhibitor [Periophthalmus magnuspinnatus]